VITMSLGSTGQCDGALQSAITEAWTRGVTLIAAAGNANQPVADDAPANCEHVISVAATTRYGNRAGYSNFGTAKLSPTIAAPGGTETQPVWGDLWSSTGAIDARGNQPVIAGYLGTSMAAPRVAAAAALLLSVSPRLTPDEVAARLRAHSTPFPSTSTCTVLRCGPGIVNAGSLLGVPKRFVHAVKATITGTARSGSRLTAHAGRWHPGARTTSYRWYRNGKPLPATSSMYRLSRRDAGSRITVRVTVSRPGYRSAAAVSPARRVAH
jgi:serine protease